VYVRPTDSVDVWANYFKPGWLGGDHTFKAGFKYREDIGYRATMYGGDACARLRNGVPSEAQLYRRQLTDYNLHNRNLYVQDTYSRSRLTLNVGIRLDLQTDESLPTSVDASPFYGAATYAGVYNGVTYTGKPFNQLPALTFAGAKARGTDTLWFRNFSPRVGLTYDLTGRGRDVLKFNYAKYVGQLGGNSGMMSPTYTTTNLTYVRYPWVDVNGDKFVQADEIVLTAVPLGYTSGYDYNNPTSVKTTGTVDPNLVADQANEILVSFDKQIGTDFAVSASYIWRKYTNFRWSPTNNWSSGNYTAVTWTPPAQTCGAGAHCAEVTYYQPTSQPGVNYTYTNQPDYWRGYQGLELSARKRMTKDWVAGASFSYNDAPAHWDSDRAYQDPTNIATSLNGGQFAEESTSSGLGNVFVNAKWIFRVSGAYTLPIWKIGIAGTWNSRSGYPFIRSVLSPTRQFSAGQATVYLDRRGDVRLPTFKQVDLKIDQSFTLAGRVKIIAGIDVFNLLNDNTTLSMRGGQNTANLSANPPVPGNSNTISSLVSPRVARFGVRMTF